MKINIALVAVIRPVLLWTKPRDRTTLRLPFLSYDQPILLSAARVVMFDILIIPAVTWTEPEDCAACSLIAASFVWNWEEANEGGANMWLPFLRKGCFEAAWFGFRRARICHQMICLKRNVWTSTWIQVNDICILFWRRSFPTFLLLLQFFRGRLLM